MHRVRLCGLNPEKQLVAHCFESGTIDCVRYLHMLKIISYDSSFSVLDVASFSIYVQHECNRSSIVDANRLYMQS